MSREIYPNVHVGDIFGRWEVLDREPIKGSKAKGTKARVWCRCLCGTERAVVVQSLRNGTSKSCGCRQKDYWAVEREKFIGKKFGRLTVESYDEKTHRYWCDCDCGGRSLVSIVTGKQQQQIGRAHV